MRQNAPKDFVSWATSWHPITSTFRELKRAAIARALLNDPSVILADEPTGDLDAETEMEIMELFREINKKGKTIIMVTHNPELSTYASRVFRMTKGKLQLVTGPIRCDAV
jgi:ABC-type lipoprotein export system ATPase subunit